MTHDFDNPHSTADWNAPRSDPPRRQPAFRTCGKQITLHGAHFADSATELAALHTASCLNAAILPGQTQTMEDFIS